MNLYRCAQMAQEQVMPVSPEAMIRSFPTPNDLHVFFTQIISSKNTQYLTGDAATSLTRIKDGDLHPDQVTFPGVKKIYSSPMEGSDEWVTIIWANDRALADQDFFNWSVEYQDESVVKPTFTRKYLVPRETYSTATIGTPLSSLVNIALTAGGTGYVAPLISITGGGGSGATAYADIDANGVVINVEILHGGSGYTSTPTVTITDSDGSGATAIAAILPQDALLVKQLTSDAPDPYGNLYIYVTRVYQTLPTVWLYIPLSVDKDNLAITLEKKRFNIATNIKVGAVISAGINGAVTASITGGSVSSTTISNAGSGYAEIVPLIFSPPASGKTATGYAFALATNGAISQIVITDAGSGYSIAPTIVILPQAVTITERSHGTVRFSAQGLTEFVAHEIVTVITQSPYADIGSALESTSYDGYQYPARVNVPYVIKYGSPIGSRTPKASIVPINIYRYWVIADVKPSVSIDEILFDDIEVQGVTYRNVIHDEFLADYNGFPLWIPASTPSYTGYMGIVDITGSQIVINSDGTVVGTSTAFTTEVQVGDLILSTFIVSHITDDLNLNVSDPPISDLTITTTPLFVSRQSAGWIGNEKVIKAEVIPGAFTKEWEVTVTKTVMR